MKNMKFAAIISAITLAATIGLVGCGSSEEPAATDTATQTETAAPAETEQTAEPEATTEATEAPAADAAATTTETTQNAYIGEQAAMDAALAEAGLTANDVTELKAELDTDDAIVHYDVDFKSGGKEYDVDVDATTGAIITIESEIDD